MSRKRFKWTRERYRKASSLARFRQMRCWYFDGCPHLVLEFYELWKRHPQHEDPLRIGATRSRLALLRDEVPF